jgi:imidazolonepropionase-like amidohydrolase
MQSFRNMTASFKSGNRDWALAGGLIYLNPAEEPVGDGVVLMKDGRITAAGSRTETPIPQTARLLDCSGFTITAGFWNSHVHFMERKWANAASIPAPELNRQLQDMLTCYGFTSVVDLSSIWENTRRLRDRIDSGETPGPRIRSTGLGLVPANPGLPPDAVLNMMGWVKISPPEIGDAAQAAAASARLLQEGVDAIKLFISAPSTASLSEAAIEAAANEARRMAKPVFAHPNSGDDVLAALRGGVDVIAHTTPHSGPWNETILATIEKRRAALTPTLAIWKHYARHDRISAQDQIVNTELDQLRAWIGAGGAVLFGNDLGAVDYDPTDEYVLMSLAGMTFPQILASLTTTPAAQFGESKRLGRIAAGLQADIVVLKADPSKDIRALTAVQYTWRDGEIIYNAQ